MQADNARPNSIQVDQEESIIPQSLPTPYYPQNNTGHDFIAAHAVEPGVSNSATQAPAADNARQCPHCPFVTTGRLDKHIKTHQGPTKCPVPSCGQYCKDITKHCKDKHPGSVPRTLWFCPHPYCKHARKGTPRLDNLKRHINSRTHHGHGGVGLEDIISVEEDPGRPI